MVELRARGFAQSTANLPDDSEGDIKVCDRAAPLIDTYDGMFLTDYQQACICCSVFSSSMRNLHRCVRIRTTQTYHSEAGFVTFVVMQMMKK